LHHYTRAAHAWHAQQLCVGARKSVPGMASFSWKGKRRTPLERSKKMRGMLFAGVAVIGMSLGLLPQSADAAWVVNNVTQYDPACGHYVTIPTRQWVPDPSPPPVVVAPAPVVVAPRYLPRGPVYRPARVIHGGYYR